MGVISRTPAEQALIDLLDGAEDWRAAARQAVIEHGLPTKRAEAWKWSDLRRASQGIDQAGETRILLSGKPAPATITLDADTDLTIEADAGVSVGSFEIEIAAGASVTLNEVHSIAADAFPNIRLEISLGEGATLERVIRSDVPIEAVPVVRSRIRVAKRATYRQATLSFGSKLSRHETHITHAGEGAAVHLGGVYLLEEGRHADFTSTVTHTGPGGVTHQLDRKSVV